MPTNKSTLPEKTLTPSVQEFISQFRVMAVRRAGSDRASYQAYADMLRLDPVARMCTEIVMLGVLLSMGEYTHPRRRIEKSVRESIAGCKGSWRKTIRRMLRYKWYGESFSELAFNDLPNGKKTLAEVKTLQPGSYTYEGDNGEIKQVVFYGLKEIKLKYEAGIHLVNSDELTGDQVWGIGACEAAYPFWQLHEILMPVLAIACQRQATPILVKKTETGENIELIDQETGRPVLDPATGNPVLVQKGWDSLRQLEELGLAGVTVIDPDDELYSVDLMVQGDFLLELLKTCEVYRMSCFLVPATLYSFSMSGLGDAGLAENHRELFENMIASTVEDLSEALIDGIFKAQIQYNFGPQSDYGWFPVNRTERNTTKLAEIIINAIKNKVFSRADIEAINRLRSFVGLEPLDKEMLSQLWEVESQFAGNQTEPEPAAEDEPDLDSEAPE